MTSKLHGHLRCRTTLLATMSFVCVSGQAPTPSPVCADTVDYHDEKSYTCHEWIGASMNCTQAVEVWNYTSAGEQSLLANCQRSCGLCPAASTASSTSAVSTTQSTIVTTSGNPGTASNELNSGGSTSAAPAVPSATQSKPSTVSVETTSTSLGTSSSTSAEATTSTTAPLEWQYVLDEENDTGWKRWLDDANVSEKLRQASHEHWIPQVCSGVLMLIFAILYKMAVVDKLPPTFAGSAAAEWQKTSVFSCFTDIGTCCYVAFCWPAVAAKNYNQAEVIGYWPACCCLYLTYQCCCVGALVRTYMSSQLKQTLGIEHNLCCDFCLSIFCFPCEIGRESMVVDAEMRVRVGCPLKVEYLQSGNELDLLGPEQELLKASPRESPRGVLSPPGFEFID